MSSGLEIQGYDVTTTTDMLNETQRLRRELIKRFGDKDCECFDRIMFEVGTSSYCNLFVLG